MSALLEFSSHPLWLNLIVFAVAAAVVWGAGTRITRYANAIAGRTGIGRAFLGMVLLGGVTSLPELATTTTAAISGSASLAVNNILGGVVMQVAILALADFMVGRDALSSVIAHPVVLLQGTFCVMLLVVVCLAIAAGDRLFVGVGAGVWAIAAMFVVFIWLLHRYERAAGWHPANHNAPSESRDAKRDTSGRDTPRGSLTRLLLLTGAAAAAITFAGFVLARTGDAVATQTGLGASFVGAVFVATATSLPEVSTVLEAVRLRRYEMAVSDIFGTNLFDVSLLFVADAFFTGNAILTTAGTFSLAAALLGIAVTTIFLAGLIERKNVAIARMGLDSVGVLVTYLAGLVLLYNMRGR